MAAPPDDMEMEKIAEDELAKLQRQFRIMEIDRATVAGGAQPALRVQRNIIGILNNELDEVLLELRLIKSSPNIMESNRVHDKLTKMLKEYDHCAAEVVAEKREIKELDFLLRQVEKEISSLKSKGPKKVDDSARAITNHIVITQLENRLDNAMKRFNAINTENCRLRQEIDRLLLDRASFNIIWNKLIKQLMDGKAHMLDLVEQAIMTYDQREEWCSKLETLKEKAAISYRKHCLDVKDLQRQLDRNLKLEDFLRTKGTVRLTAADAKAEAKRLEQKERDEELYNSNVNILETIKEFAGEEDIDKLVLEFKRREEENYALFNYVNEVNSELKNLDDSVKQLHDNLEEERSKHRARLEQQEESLEILQDTLKECKEEADNFDVEYEKCRKILNKILNNISELSTTMKCDTLPLLQLLGKNTIVSDTNVKLYLKIIDRKVTEVSETIHQNELQRKQAMDQKEKTPPSTRRKGMSVKSSRRSPRDRPHAAQSSTKRVDKLLLPPQQKVA